MTTGLVVTHTEFMRPRVRPNSLQQPTAGALRSAVHSRSASARRRLSSKSRYADTELAVPKSPLRFRALVLVLFLAVVPSCASNAHTPRSSEAPAPNGARATSAKGRVVITWPPYELEELHPVQWRGAFKDAAADARPGSPGADAFLIGSWWALIDWCKDGHKPCAERAARYIETSLGMDPRDVDACDWSGGGLGGALTDDYALTSSLLRWVPVESPMVPDLAKGRGPWSQFQRKCVERPDS
jgi:hypothetical protein